MIGGIIFSMESQGNIENQKHLQTTIGGKSRLELITFLVVRIGRPIDVDNFFCDCSCGSGELYGTTSWC